MSRQKESRARAAKQRIDAGLETLREALGPYVAKHMADRYGKDWRHYASRAQGGGARGGLDVYALLKTLLDNWNDLFRHDDKLRRARSFISLAIDARNSAAHFAGRMDAREALRGLDAMRELAAAAGGAAQAKIIEKLYDDQRAADGTSGAVDSDAPALDEPPPPERLRPWREVCEPHPDVLEARFSEAEFAANLALVDRGAGGGYRVR